MFPLVLVMAALTTEPNPHQLDLLKTFREEFIAITPGNGEFPTTFYMGTAADVAAESPRHEVSFAYSFHVARYEVPQNLWEAVMGSNPSRWKGPRNSVEMITFDEAMSFCRKTTDLLRAAKLIAGDEVIRLPSEAEWEYCARAGTTTLYSFGDDPAKLDDYGWYTGNAAGNDPPVGAKKPNPWGLYDVHGYLWEWCADPWHDNYSGAPADASVWTGDGDPMQRVLRGGSWRDRAAKTTSSYRQAAPATHKFDSIGLRCILAKAPKAELSRPAAPENQDQ